MRVSKWYSISVCTKCRKELNSNDVMYAGGTCPNCGHNSGATVCDYDIIVIRRIKHHKWWQIFNKKITYQGKDHLSKQWLASRKKTKQ